MKLFIPIFIAAFYSLSLSQPDTLIGSKDTLLLTGRRFARPKPSADPASDRLFYSANGEPQKDGVRLSFHFAYVQDAPVITFPSINIGLYDIVSLGAGISLTPFGVFVLNAKITPLRLRKTFVSVGGFFYGYLLGDSEIGGVLYAAATQEFRGASLTGAVGFSTSGGPPIIILGGDVRVVKEFKLMTENWFLFSSGSDFSLHILGGRITFQQAAIDAGVAFLTASSSYGPGFVTVAPTVSLSVGF